LQKSIRTLVPRAPFRRDVARVFQECTMELDKQRQDDFIEACNQLRDDKDLPFLKTQQQLNEFEVAYRKQFGYPTIDQSVAAPLFSGVLQTDGTIYSALQLTRWCEVTRMDPSAMDALLCSFESTMNDIFTTTQLYALQAGRITVKDRDLKLYLASHPNITAAVDCESLLMRCPQFKLRQRPESRRRLRYVQARPAKVVKHAKKPIRESSSSSTE
jgi:histone H3/H4